MANRVVWFDIPVEDLRRASEFYSKVLDISVQEAHGVAVLEHSGNDVAGCLFKSDEEKPSDHGSLLYFNVRDAWIQPSTPWNNAVGGF